MLQFTDIHTHKISEGDDIYILNTDATSLPKSEYISIGIHPWDIEKSDIPMKMALTERLCLEKRVIAIGEAGIDKAVNIPLQKQKDVFIQQSEMAERYSLPVIIHCVKAYSEFLELHKKIKPSVVWIFHGFNSSAETANQLIEKGCMLSFGKALVYSGKLQKVFTTLSLSNIFLETDDSEESIKDIYKKAAELHNINVIDLKKQMLNNFYRVFNTFAKK